MNSRYSASIHLALLVITFMSSCAPNPESRFSIALGQISAAAPEQQFRVDIKNFESFPWRLCLIWNSTDKKEYYASRLTVFLANTGSVPIITAQNTGRTTSATIVVPPLQTRVLYRGTLSSFIGLDQTQPPSELSFRSDGSERVKCDLKIKLENVVLTNSIRVGLCRSEPSL